MARRINATVKKPSFFYQYETVDLPVKLEYDEDTGQLTMKVQRGGGGTNNYNALVNKPSINGVQLIGEKSIEDLGVDTMTNTEILDVFNRAFN